MNAILHRPFDVDPYGGIATPSGLAPAAAPQLALHGVTKSFGGAPVLSDIDLRVESGEFVAIVGHSGSGKSTLLSLIAGLLAADSGSITLEGKPLAGPGPDRGMVFQGYALMPWLTVGQNIGLAVDAVQPGLSRARRGEIIRWQVERVGLLAAIDKRPGELSGGMRQRVAVARALAMDPAMLLLDEPLSALDALTRARLQDEILGIWERERKTVLLVTNDVDEAIYMADRVIPLTTGPGATLAPGFAIDLERPRDRLALNHDPEFQRLRREVTACLLDLGDARRASGGPPPALPAVRPNTAPELKPVGAVHGAARRPADVSRYCVLDGIGKVYPSPGGPVKVVDGFDLDIRQGEFVSLIGHSGCGKSTVLSMLAGLTEPSEGTLVLDYRELGGAGPDRGVVFQAPCLVPWLTARENVMLGVRSVYPHIPARERQAIAEHFLARVGLADALDRRAAELSNGMRQRVGIARAFALQPKMLLLDEPFGMLDTLTRWELQEVLMDVWSSTGLTALMVTHDVDEAILLADRVVMMTNGPQARVGRILTVDLPRPRTRRALLAHPDYYPLREAITGFLESCGHGGAST
jgi:nitrate/nitrite transport system ATP-binding protein